MRSVSPASCVPRVVLSRAASKKTYSVASTHAATRISAARPAVSSPAPPKQCPKACKILRGGCQPRITPRVAQMPCEHKCEYQSRCRATPAAVALVRITRVHLQLRVPSHLYACHRDTRCVCVHGDARADPTLRRSLVAPWRPERHNRSRTLVVIHWAKAHPPWRCCWRVCPASPTKHDLRGAQMTV